MLRVGSYCHLDESGFSRELAWQLFELRVNAVGEILWRQFKLGKQLFDCLGEAQNWRCCYCGIRMDTLDVNRTQPTQPTIEHLIPLRKGGKDHPENLVIACCLCNSTKGDTPAEEFRPAYAIKVVPARPVKTCFRCEEELELEEFIPNTDCCFGCHELTLMQETGVGVVRRGPLPGSIVLNGEVYRIKI